MPPFPCSKTLHAVSVYLVSEYAVKLTEKKKKKMHFSPTGSKGPDVVHKICPEAHKNLAIGSELQLKYRFKITVEEALRL